MTSLRQALGLGDSVVISLVGAGGKTSLMYGLAHELSLAGDPVLTTTTTKIYMPEPAQSSRVLVSDSVTDLLVEARNLLHEYRHVTLARDKWAEKGKLIGFAPEIIDAIHDSRLFQWIIVEADGAAGRPLKAPADHEPVVPHSTDIVVGVAGLQGFGQPLTDQWVFRPDRFAELTGVSHNTKITEEAVARVITHQNGIFRNTSPGALRLTFLNQADLNSDRKAGQRIANLILADSGARINRVVVGQLRSESPAWEIFNSGHSHH